MLQRHPCSKLSMKALYSASQNVRHQSCTAITICFNTRLILNVVQEKKFFEEAFQVYERGIALFKWPHVKDIWNAYLSQFVERYKGNKLERARDLFKQALSTVSS